MHEEQTEWFLRYWKHFSYAMICGYKREKYCVLQNNNDVAVFNLDSFMDTVNNSDYMALEMM
jgi:hypothetical protein